MGGLGDRLWVPNNKKKANGQLSLLLAASGENITADVVLFSAMLYYGFQWKDPLLSPTANAVANKIGFNVKNIICIQNLIRYSERVGLNLWV